MGSDLQLRHDGNVITDEQVRMIIKQCKEELNTVPSFPIVLFYYQSYWGNTLAGKLNNNWNGLKWNDNWSDPFTLSSGVTVSKGTERPIREGGFYIKYSSFNDYLIDWCWFMRRGGMYRITDTNNFTSGIRGLFIFGGANTDYINMNVLNSKERYILFLKEMEELREKINSSNDMLLNKIDNDDYEWGEETDPPEEIKDYPDVVYPVVKDIENMVESIKTEVNHFQDKILDTISNMIRIRLYDLSEDIMGNKYIRIDKLIDNMYILRPNLSFNKNLDNDIDKNNNKLSEYKGDIKDLTNKGSDILASENDVKPNYEKNPAYPTVKGLRISSYYGHRGNVTGVAGASKFHKGIDIAGGGKEHPIYATQTGKVYINQFSSTGGYMVFIKHSGDTFYSCYMHLKEKPNLTIGQEVEKGQVIGTMGNTGNSSGIHLHFGISKTDVFNNSQYTIDPLEYLKMEF